MSRLCDDLLVAPLLDIMTGEPVAGEIRANWRRTMMDCERIDASSVWGLLPDEGELGPDTVPSLRLPFPMCWVEMKTGDSATLKGNGSRMGAAFYEKHRNDGETVIVAVLAYQPADASAVCHVTSFQAQMRYHPSDDGSEYRVTQNWSVYYRDGESPPISRQKLDEFCVAYNLLLTAVGLLSVRNVGTQVISPEQKVQEKRLRRGREPLLTYRVLTVTIGGKTRPISVVCSAGGGRNLPLHKRRGHYIRFTAERPAFGRHTGKAERYWVPPGYVGNPKDGVILKDYRLEPPKPDEAA